MIRTKIWAHRGASDQAPENTLAAFKLAVDLQADGVELDVQRTADGVLVVTHDENCKRVTGISGLIWQKTLQELRELNFAGFLPKSGWQALPTLGEVFDLLRESSLTINIELKNNRYAYAGMEEQVLRLIKDQRMQDQVVLSSFNHGSMLSVIQLCRELGLAIPCGLLYHEGWPHAFNYARKIGAAAIHPHLGNLKIPDLVKNSHAAGIAVNVWTVDRPKQQANAFLLGVDALMTNKPAQARKIRDQLNVEEEGSS